MSFFYELYHILQQGDEMKYSIEVHNLRKCYGNLEVVKGISFSVPQNEIVAFLGPNGAGKSTTISILATLCEFDAGSVCMEGHMLGRENYLIHQTLGVVFQESMLDENLSVRQNLMLRCGLYQQKKQQRKDIVKEVMELCNLQRLAHQNVKCLSGGQKRRVDIARSLLSSPSLLILDEPSSGLDANARKELWEMIKTLHQKRKITIFFTTHYLEESEIADHIIMIHQGVILLDKSKEELQSKYRQEYLILYSKTLQNLQKILQQRRYVYDVYKDCVHVKVRGFYDIMAILRACEWYIHRVEFHQDSMEELYINILKGEKECK